LHAIELDSSAFDHISLHDVRVYALVFQRLEHQGNLILDIDYIAEWDRCENGKHSFLVVPATLTFLDIVDLQVHLDWGDRSVCEKEPHGVISYPSGELIVNGLTRSVYNDPLYNDRPRPYLRYELDFWEPQGARVSLGATDFKIIGRQAPVWAEQQTLDPAQRVPLVSGGN